jgi:ice-binding like protein
VGIGIPAAIVIAALTLTLAGGASAGSSTTPLLGTAANFSVLAGSAVTNTGPTVLASELGVSPGAAITGFPPGLARGATHSADAVASGAQNDLTIAYNDAAADKTTTTVPDVGNIGGETLTAGVYASASSMLVNGTLTLNGAGNPNAVFVFKAGSTIVTGSASKVLLENGAQACNVYWQVGSSATLGTDSSFVGTVMALTSITATTDVTIDGRLLARNGAVTLDSDTIAPTSCTTTVSTKPVVAPPTTSTTTHTSGGSGSSSAGKSHGATQRGAGTTTTTTTTTTASRSLTSDRIHLPSSDCGCAPGTKYVKLATSKYAHVTVNQSTGVARFRVAAGHYGVFTCDLQYGDKVIVVHFAVKPTKSSAVPCVA